MAFRLPTHVTIRPGCLSELPAAAATGGSRVLLVYDEGLKQTPWPERVRRALETQHLDVTTFDQIEPNPRHTTVDALAEQARTHGIEQVIGLGGGSVLDAAKAVAMLVTNPGSCVDYEGRNRYQDPPIPFVAVPTTCGTGSEVTWVSVITHVEERRKMSIKGESLFPDAAFVDADVLTTLPSSLVAYTGLDALTHALEAYTCRAANPISDALAEQAVVLLFRYLRRAVADIAGDAEAREAVMRAATLAGMAFGNADVAAVHCLSETIGGLWDVPHGLANAIFLAPVMRYHLDAIRPRLARLHTLVAPSAAGADPKNAAQLVAAIERLVTDLDIPSFASLDLPDDEYPRIAARAVDNNSNGSNPQPMDKDAYLDILQGM